MQKQERILVSTVISVVKVIGGLNPIDQLGGSEVGQPLSIHVFCVVYQCLSWFILHICW